MGARFPDCRILVFARAPEPGHVKTRLVPCLGESAATELHSRMVRHCLATAVEARCGPVELWCTPSTEHGFFRDCASRFSPLSTRLSHLPNHLFPLWKTAASVSPLWKRGARGDLPAPPKAFPPTPVKPGAGPAGMPAPGPAIEMKQQPEGDIGRRMACALEQALAGSSTAIAIGTDCPALTPDDLRAACQHLQRGAEAVFCPAEDGGYVLVGVSRFDPRLFEGITWSTPAVMAQTRARLAELGWRWQELPTRWDVDRPEDVERLARTPGLRHLVEGLLSAAGSLGG